MDVPFPTEEKLLFSVVTLARIMSKSAKAIYRKHHDSLLPLWRAANEIRLELRAFAVQLREDFNFGVRDDPNTGELGMCQTIVSTLYHHTLILTFRPFLILRAALRQKDIEGTGHTHPPPPPWLDTAAEYCIDAARHSIAFLIRAFEKNEFCRGIRYHGFFIEGASHVLAFELLNNVNAAGREAHLHWIQLAIRALQLVTHNRNAKFGTPFPVDVAGNLERMIRSVYPDFRADQVNMSAMLPSIPSIQSGILNSDTAIGQAQQHQQPQSPTGANAFGSDTSMIGHDDSTALAKKGLYSPSTGGHRRLGSANAAPPFPLAQHQVLQTPQLQLPIINPIPPSMTSMPTSNTLGNISLNSGLNLTDVSSLSNLSNALPPLLFPFTPFGGLDEASSVDRGPNADTIGLGGPSTQLPHRNGLLGGDNLGDGQAGGTPGEAPPADLTAADLGCDIDFGTMNMEAFLSFDPNMPYSF
ncbi:MAG: hypothetical protein SEPTF4163_001899 [Sporothrix epigloea]